MSRLYISRTLTSFARILDQAGYECHLVGGAVRDMLLGIPNGDFDIATNADPETVIGLYRRVIPTGIRHGTVTVLYQGHQIEVTTYRTEADYTDGRRPDDVRFVGSIEEDLKRRDFTMNAIAVECLSGKIVDPLDGRSDIARGVIRAIGVPRERFEEDGLRLIRACRFAAQLAFKIDPGTHEGMQANLDALRGVSAERIRDEILKTLAANRPSAGFESMAETGVLARILPELDACRGIEQKGMHRFDVFEHSLIACDAASSGSPEVRFAALLHDIGKPEARQVANDGTITFHRHEEISARLAAGILKRLKFPKVFAAKVEHLIAQHMFHYESHWSDAAVRRFVHRVGRDSIRELFALRVADSAAIEGTAPVTPEQSANLSELGGRINEVLANDEALTIKDLAVDGNTLASRAGIPKSRDMGIVLAYLLESVLDDPSLNDEDRLISIARRFYDSRMRLPRKDDGSNEG